jgi:hypothetical protein
VSVIYNKSGDDEANQYLDGQSQRRRSESGDGEANLPPDVEAPSGQSDSGDGVDPPPGEDLRRPSEYLKKCCPLCFGGSKSHDQNDR